jgi:Tol biopolymer transport system component
VRGDIWVKAVGNETLRRLTDTPLPEYNPSWSPDGREIAFVRGGDNRGIFIVSQLGGPERKVSDSGNVIAWAPDGKSILIRDAIKDAPMGIHQIFLDTLSRRQITQPETGIGDWRFEVSPDGSTLAFVRFLRGNVADLYTVPMSGGAPRKRTVLGANLGGVAWTPDGREIVFSHNGLGSHQLARIAAGDYRLSRGSPVLLPAPAFYPAISRPGEGRPPRLVFQTGSSDFSIRLIDLSANRSGKIGNGTALFDATVVDHPGSFSPDGSMLALTSERSGQPQVWVGEN